MPLLFALARLSASSEMRMTSGAVRGCCRGSCCAAAPAAGRLIADDDDDEEEDRARCALYHEIAWRIAKGVQNTHAHARIREKGGPEGGGCGLVSEGSRLVRAMMGGGGRGRREGGLCHRWLVCAPAGGMQPGDREGEVRREGGG